MNVWRRFQQLANPPSLVTVGLCVDAEFGSCTIELIGGSRIRVVGAGTTGKKYFIKDGRLDGEAPDLDVQFIDI